MKASKYIASVSFGKDSLATLLLALKHGEPLDEAVYCEVRKNSTVPSASRTLTPSSGRKNRRPVMALQPHNRSLVGFSQAGGGVFGGFDEWISRQRCGMVLPAASGTGNAVITAG